MRDVIIPFLQRRLAVFIVCLVIVLIGITPAMAEPEGPKIAVVNMDIIMHNSIAAKNIRAQIDKKRTQYQGKIKKQEKELLSYQQGFLKEQDNLKVAVLDEKKKLFKQKVVTAQKDAQNEMRQIDLAVKSALQELRKKSANIVGEIAKKRGFEIVLSHQQVVMALGSLDITKELLVRLDKEVKAIPVKWK